jgi:hypothetical protein
MALTWYRWREEAPLLYDNLCGGFEVLLYDAQEERGVKGLGDRFRRIDDSLRMTDLVVFRSSRGPSVVSDYSSDPVIRALLDDVPSGVLHRQQQLQLGPLLTPLEWSRSLPSILLSDLRQGEIYSLLECGGAIFGDDHSHFYMPSGYHANRFVRLADAVADPVNVRRLVDWILESVSADSVILADTGTILPVVQGLQNAALAEFGVSLPIEVLNGYPVKEAALKVTVSDLRSRYGEGRPLVLLVSVNSSGNLIEMFSHVDVGRNSTLVVCDTGPSSTRALARVPVRTWKPDVGGECDGCKTDAAAISIDPRSYEQRPNFSWSKFGVTPNRASADSWFWQLVSDRNLARLHTDKARHLGDSRHLAVWIDVEALLEAEPFRKSCLDALCGFGIIDLILMPPRVTHTNLWAILQERFPQATFVELVQDGLPLLDDDLLHSAQAILVVDDAAVTGTSLVRLRRQLFNRLAPLRVNPPTSAFVPLLRPADRNVEHRLRRAFGGPMEAVAYGWQVYLPSGASCPWCKERDFIEGEMASLPSELRPVAKARYDQLQGELTESALWLAESVQPGLRTEGSFFGDLSQIVAFAAASSVVQAIRQDLRRATVGSSIDVINVASAIESYYDDIFLSAILRTCMPRELRYVGFDGAVDERVAALIELDIADRLAVELGFAAALGKLPSGGVERVLTARPASAEVALALQLTGSRGDSRPDATSGVGR